MPIDVELAACRVHARRGGDIPTFRWATVRLANGLMPRAEWFAARALLNEIPDDDHDAESLRSLASVEDSLGEWKTARSLLERARKSLADDRAGEAVTWYQLASIDLEEGAYPAAREKFVRSLGITQAIGDRAGEAATWQNLATIDLREGAYPAAREKFARSLEITQAIGDRAGEAGTWHQLATIDLNEGAYPAAREKFVRSLGITQAIGDRAGEAATWHQLASIDLEEGAYAAAREKFARSLAIDQATGNRADEAVTWHQLATIDLNEGAYPAAREKFARSLEIQQAIGDRAREAAVFFQFGALACKLGRNHDGARLIAICYLIDKAIGHGDAESDFRALDGLCQSLGYDQARFDAVLVEAGREYQRDRGWALIERALAEGDARKPGGPVAASGRKGLLGTLRGILGALGSGKRQGPDPS